MRTLGLMAQGSTNSPEGSTPGEAQPARDRGTTPPTLPYRGVNEHGVVTREVACRGCGYKLERFSLSQVCPECGWPVARSVQGEGLLHTPPTYLRTVRSSITIIIAALLVDVVSTFGVVILDIINDNFPTQWNLEPLHIASDALSFLANVVTVWGFWRFTTPDPTLSRAEQRTSAYWILRIATLTAAISGFVETVFAMLARTGNYTPAGIIEILMTVFGIAVYVLTAAWISAAMHFVSAMALRVPDPILARRTKVMVWLTWVLMFPGMLACFMGPIACVVYIFIVLIQLREHIGQILGQQSGYADQAPA